MKITIQRSTLLERLQQVTKALGSKIVIPILEGVKFDSNAELTLTCSDSNLTIMTTLDDYVEHEAGSTVIPARKLLEVISKMPEREISITVNGSVAEIKCGKSKVNLPAMDADEYPNKTWPDMTMVTIAGESFAALIDSTKYAVATDQKTAILQGLLIEQQSGKVVATATDRHRLAKHSFTLSDAGADQDSRHVAPIKALDAVSRLKPNEVELHFTDSEVYLAAKGYRFIASLFSGSYPDTSKIIPTEPQVTAKVETAQMLQTLELAERIAEGKTKVVRLDVTDNEIKVSAKHEGSSMEETLEAETNGEITIAANGRYLIDALKCIETEKVEVWFTGPMSPVIIRAEGDDSGLHLVLPYRTAV